MSLSEQTLFIGQNHIHLDSVDSTNAFAQILLSKSSPSEGTVITTSFQSSGRGQIGRSWHSTAGENIMCSVILYPKFLRAKEQFTLNMAISCAVQAFIQSYVPKKNVWIKWPNDIYIRDKKVAGLLLQNTLKGQSIASSIVGIGINVNELDFPAELPNPTSIGNETGVTYKLEHLRKQLYKAIESYYLTLRAAKVLKIRSDYIQALYLKDKAAMYRKPDGETFSGIIQYVDDQGKLVMLIEGREHRFNFRELQFVVA